MFKKRLMHLMPYFEADGKGGAGGAGGTGGEGTPPGGDGGKGDGKDGTGEKKYTDKDVDSIVAKKFAIWKAEEEKKQAEEKKKADEAAKLAEMNATEKANYERDQALKKAEDAEKKLTLLNMAKEARQMLSERSINISDDLLAVIVDADSEKTKSNVDSFVKMFNAAVDAEVKERLKGKTPQAGAGKATMKKEDIMAIKDPIERQKAIVANKELFGL